MIQCNTNNILLRSWKVFQDVYAANLVWSRPYLVFCGFLYSTMRWTIPSPTMVPLFQTCRRNFTMIHEERPASIRSTLSPTVTLRRLVMLSWLLKLFFACKQCLDVTQARLNCPSLIDAFIFYPNRCKLQCLWVLARSALTTYSTMAQRWWIKTRPSLLRSIATF